LIAPPAFSFTLRRTGDRLELLAGHHPDYGPICADWTTPEIRRRVAGGKRQLLGKAVGLARLAQPRVLDATAGLGRDAFVLASLGAQVTLAERNATVAALLADARLRALADPAAAGAAARTTIVGADARNLMALPSSAVVGGPAGERFDVVYLDPMYPDRGKSALAKKELQLLRELAGPDDDAAELLEPALANARRRVVVKRPLRAPPLARRQPSLAFAGTQARFDVYLVAN
jgi:16S rRNA (guanine1516-N2)-methyltransferase